LLREVIPAAVIGRILNLTGRILIFEDNVGVANFALRLEHKGRPSANACNRNSFRRFPYRTPFQSPVFSDRPYFCHELKAKFNSRRF